MSRGDSTTGTSDSIAADVAVLKSHVAHIKMGIALFTDRINHIAVRTELHSLTIDDLAKLADRRGGQP